jgi:hypothetical protein
MAEAVKAQNFRLTKGWESGNIIVGYQRPGLWPKLGSGKI